MKMIGVFFLYFALVAGAFCLLWRDVPVRTALLNGACVGVIGVAIYGGQQVRKPKDEQ